MYCQKCGKEIATGSVFCTWCGARQEMPVPQPEVIPQESPAQQAPVQENAAPAAAPTAVMTPEAPTETSAEAAAPEEPKAEPAAETPRESAPAPETAPDNAAENAAPGAELPKEFFGDEIKLDSEAKPGEKPQKYYTTAHLVICLAAAGIMAAAAGIFAGLYFSVIG